MYLNQEHLCCLVFFICLCMFSSSSWSGYRAGHQYFLSVFGLILLYYDYGIMKTISYSLHNFLFLLLVWMEHLEQAGHWQTTLVPFVWQGVTHPLPSTPPLQLNKCNTHTVLFSVEIVQELPSQCPPYSGIWECRRSEAMGADNHVVRSSAAVVQLLETKAVSRVGRHPSKIVRTNFASPITLPLHILVYNLYIDRAFNWNWNFFWFNRKIVLK